jgi:hypothetical protein
MKTTMKTLRGRSFASLIQVNERRLGDPGGRCVGAYVTPFNLLDNEH